MRGRPTSPLFVKKGMHKAELFGYFLKLVPILAEKFPEKSIVIRPHPSESFEAWRAAGNGFDNVHVVHKGHVHPWLLASDVHRRRTVEQLMVRQIDDNPLAASFMAGGSDRGPYYICGMILAVLVGLGYMLSAIFFTVFVVLIILIFPAR